MRTRAIVTKNTIASASRDREDHLLSAAITDLSLSVVHSLEKNQRELRERDYGEGEMWREKEEEEEEEEEQRKRVVMSVKALDKTDLL